MKKFIVGLITGFLLATTTLAYAAGSITMQVNGREVRSDVPPQIIDGRVMLPVRALAESLGAEVEWDAAASTVQVTKEEPEQNTLTATPLNKTGKIKITGSDDFKENIQDALALLEEMSSRDHSLVTDFVTEIKNEDFSGKTLATLGTSPGIIKLDWKQFKDYTNTNRLSSKTKKMFLASVLVHEAYHTYNIERGINSMYNFRQENLSGISRLEDEVLAHLRQRRFLLKAGAPQRVLDANSLDYVADTNYNYSN